MVKMVKSNLTFLLNGYLLFGVINEKFRSID